MDDVVRSWRRRDQLSMTNKAQKARLINEATPHAYMHIMPSSIDAWWFLPTIWPKLSDWKGNDVIWLHFWFTPVDMRQSRLLVDSCFYMHVQWKSHTTIPNICLCRREFYSIPLSCLSPHTGLKRRRIFFPTRYMYKIGAVFNALYSDIKFEMGYHTWNTGNDGKRRRGILWRVYYFLSHACCMISTRHDEL